MGLHHVHERIKKKAQPAADTVSTYGIEILGRRIDYATFVGLVLNQERVQRRRAIVIIEAISAALSPALDKAFFDASADTPEKADVDFERYKARRQIEQSLSGTSRRSFDGSE